MDEFAIEKCRYGKIILMTDADVDGAHIRTLLLTFFFRQMQELFTKRMIYIAQPPLYEIKIKGKKNSEYILSESRMHKKMIAMGIEGTQLVIRDEKKPRKIVDKQLTELVKILSEAERLITVLNRRGIKFADFVPSYYNGKELPQYRIWSAGQDEFYFDKDKYEERLDKLNENTIDKQDAESEEKTLGEDLHEVGHINLINKKLQGEYALDLKDFLLKPAKTVAGEALPTRFQLISGEDEYEIASLGDICAGIRQIGGKDIEIKRFKGLGEMNAEQLWETTMNPETRTLLKVKLEDAGEADRLFSILMGDDVEQRRNFIHDHAMEVQNLDI